LEPPDITNSIDFLLVADVISFSFLIPLCIISLLLICSALISGSEVAFFSLSPSDVQELKDDKTKINQRVLTLLDSPNKLLATILIANNLVNVAIIILSTFIVDKIYPEESRLKYFIQVVAITFVIVLVGEVLPKVYATKYSARLARFMSFPLVVMKNVFSPLSTMLIKGTSFIDKRIKKRGANISEMDLEPLLELTKDETFSEDEKNILKGIATFGSTDVKQIMKSRVDVVAFEKQTNYDDLMSEIIASGYSRIPIYEESFDKVEGVLYIKDLLPYLDEKNGFDWQKLIRVPFFVPESKKIDDLLKEFQEKKIHLAIVVDEYGGTSGIVTLEDIIEEIVGDITDEFDDEDLVYSKLDDNNYVFEGKTPLMDLYRVLDIDGHVFEEQKGDSDTLAGFLLEKSGKILKKNERVHFENYTFVIEASDKRRIKQVKLTIKDPKGSNAENLSGLTSIILLLIGLFFVSCSGGGNYIPKPRGFFKTDFPEKGYVKLTDNLCPYSFEYPTYAAVKNHSDEYPCYKNIDFEKYKATLHLTYQPIENNLRMFSEQSISLVNEHMVKATAIEDTLMIDDDRQMYTMFYDLKGNVASYLQFYATDSSDHFIRGALYFNAIPNYDSIAPTLHFIRQDIIHMLSTFEWRK